LLRLGARQQHAEREHSLKALVIDPFALVDEYSMHERDLTGWTTKAQTTDFQRFAEHSRQARLRTIGHKRLPKQPGCAMLGRAAKDREIAIPRSRS